MELVKNSNSKFWLSIWSWEHNL